jgi:hypothetical protein
MMGLTGLAVWWRFKNKLFEKRWVLWTFVFSVLAPVAANQLGWMHTCVVGQCQILCNDDDACPQDLGTTMTCGVIGNSRWCEAKDDAP